MRFRDHLPVPVTPVRTGREGGTLTTERPSPLNPEVDDHVDRNAGDSLNSTNHALTVTNANSFGVFREYHAVHSHNPHDPDAFEDVAVTTAASLPQSIGSGLMVTASMGLDLPDELKNKSEHLLFSWMALGSGNTPAGMNDLVHNTLRHPNFDLSELEDFNAVTTTRRFEREHFSKRGTTLKVGDGWKEGSVSIRVPCTKVQQKESDAPEFIVDGILYRDIVEVISAELEDQDAFENIHITPYKEWWCPCPGDDPVRVYSETYNSDATLQADEKVRDKLGTTHGPDTDLEAFVVSAILYSNSTHLASFGNASLWPIYLFLGNVSKYIRSKPTSFSAHHIAYLPTVRPLIVIQLDDIFLIKIK